MRTTHSFAQIHSLFLTIVFQRLQEICQARCRATNTRSLPAPIQSFKIRTTVNILFISDADFSVLGFRSQQGTFKDDISIPGPIHTRTKGFQPTGFPLVLFNTSYCARNFICENTSTDLTLNMFYSPSISQYAFACIFFFFLIYYCKLHQNWFSYKRTDK